MTAEEFRLPDVGEGLEEAEIVTWHVAVGDAVAHNQVLVEIETAKSLVELPSPFEGTVTALLVAEGETVAVGTPIIAIGTAVVDGGDPAPPAGDATEPLVPSTVDREPTSSTADRAAQVGAAQSTVDGGDVDPAPSVLVGYGPTEARSTRRRRRAPAPGGPADAPADNGAVGPAVGGNGAGPTRAKPPVRKLAKDLGVDLGAVPASGDAITRDDVLRFADAAPAPGAEPGPRDGAGGASGVDGATTRIPIKGVRKATAAAMVDSAFSAPHVTEFLTVDVTRSVKLVEKLKADPAFDGTRVTMLLLVARALLAAVRQFPDINASWDQHANEIVLHRDVNLGIAAATPRGLMVPNIKDAGALSLPALAGALTELTGAAKAGNSTPEDMSRGTITITNIGVFGVDAGTPILNPGEAAILCLGAVRRVPWEHKGDIALRWTTQLSLSFDHRLVDGELGSRVLARVGRILENPKWELLLG